MKSLICIPLLVFQLALQTSRGLGQETTSPEIAAGASSPGLFYSGPVPRTPETTGDARLNDVCAVGSSCWAVGERGVVVRSTDSGTTWITSWVPSDCSLKSVCFLTNRIGFVAGTRFDHKSRRHTAVLLKTTDGGDSWTDMTQSAADLHGATNKVSTLATEKLPPLRCVKFFDLEHAIAVGCDGTVNSASKILSTTDGGLSWKAIPCDTEQASWHFGEFLSPQHGVLVGEGNATGAVAGHEIITVAAPRRTLQQYYDASLSADGTGWIVGDGNLILQSGDRGVTWRPPAGRLSPQLSNLVDLYSVDHHESTICAVGAPGSIVLHSADAGSSWTFRQMQSPVPIHRIRFVAPSTVIAVGSLGVIHRSGDSGLTWNAVRNGAFRTAVVSFTTRTEDCSYRMLADISGDQGYRSVVVQASAELPSEQSLAVDSTESARTATASAGGDDYVRDWMFARDQPMQHRVRDELLKTWARQTDGRVAELLPLRLARGIRIWRPAVITVEFRSAENAAAAVLLESLEQARQIAAGEDPNGTLLDRIGLEPWQPPRVFIRQTGRSRSPVRFHASDVLHRCGTTTGLIADYCDQLTRVTRFSEAGKEMPSTDADSYRIYSPLEQSSTPFHLLSGVDSSPGSDSRRQLQQPDVNGRLMEQIVKRQATEKAALRGHMQMTETPLNMIASLERVGSKLPDRLALQQLLYLADFYDSLDDLDGRIAVLNEITHRFPAAPESADAAETLFLFYSSEELRYLRRRTTTGESVNGRLIQNVSGSIPGIPTVSRDQLRAGRNPFPVNGVSVGTDITPGRGTLLGEPVGRESAAVDTLWNRKAAAALQLLNQVSPDRASSPEVLVRQAANARRTGASGNSQTLLSRAAAAGGFHSLAARAELQATWGAALNPLPTINARQTLSKPFLDGNLADPCWQAAPELHLHGSDDVRVSDDDCLVMLCWDDEFIYIAARVEFAAETHEPIDRTAARHHDTNHGIRDRLSITFDTDRDYVTGFRFTIDEAGQTSESCWQSRKWNPKWFVAEAADENVWRFEAAIPYRELGRRQIRPGELWAVRLQRLSPGVTEQSLRSENSDSSGGTRGYGLLRFIRSQK